MIKLNGNKKIVLELFLIFDECWKNEDELVELGEKHGYKIKEVYELHRESGGAAKVLAIAPISLLLKEQYIYEKDEKYYNQSTDEEIA